MFPLLSLRVWYFPYYVEVSLDSTLERIFVFFKKKKFSKISRSILCRMDKYNLFLSTNIILLYVATILIDHFLLFFSNFSQRIKFYVKRKNDTQSSCMTIFSYFMSDRYIFWKVHYSSKWYHNEYKEHVTYYSVIQSSI